MTVVIQCVGREDGGELRASGRPQWNQGGLGSCLGPCVVHSYSRHLALIGKTRGFRNRTRNTNLIGKE